MKLLHSEAFEKEPMTKPKACSANEASASNDLSSGQQELSTIVHRSFEEVPLKEAIVFRERIAHIDSTASANGASRKASFTQTWMLFWLCWYCTMQGMLVSGLVPSVISTVERRFNFKSSSLGRIMQSYDIAYAVFCTPLAYFGGRHSKPLYLGIGLLVLSSGSFLFSLPHIISDRSLAHEYKKTELSYCNLTTGNASRLKATPFWPDDISVAKEALDCSTEACVVSQSALSDSAKNEVGSSLDQARNLDNVVENNFHYEQLFAFAHFLNGIGSAPLFTLGVSYIDDNVESAQSSFYIGIFYTCVIFGPSAGFFLSSILLQVHTDFLFAYGNDFAMENYNEEDPEWVGAWWFGFQVAALLCLVAVIPILGLPHRPKSKRNEKTHQRRLSHVTYQIRPEAKSELAEPAAYSVKVSVVEEVVFSHEPQGQSAEQPQVSSKNGLVKQLYKDIRHIPVAVFKLLYNPCYMCITLAAAFAGVLISGFSGFTAKYLERQFSVRSSKANLLIASIMVPFAATGTLLSGYVVKKFKLSTSSTLKMCVVMEVCALTLSPMFLLYCEPTKYLNFVEGNSGPSNAKNSTAVDQAALSPLYQRLECYGHCSCLANEFHPVCGVVNGTEMSFISPCFAGCPEKFERSKKLYKNCTCVPGATVTAGLCESRCSSLILFLLLFAPMCFFTFSVGVPALSVVLRSVEYNERALALGVQGILIRCIGTIPAPAIFGSLFDAACLVSAPPLHNTIANGEPGGRCLIHSTKMLADLFLCFAVLCQLLTGGFLILAAYFEHRASTYVVTNPLSGSASGADNRDVQVESEMTTICHHDSFERQQVDKNCVI